MAQTKDIAKFADISNAVFNSISANATAINSITVGGSSINSTSFPGTANNADNLGGSSLATIQGQITGNAATAYTNAASYANTAAGTAYSNAVTYADNKAANAYSNAISYAENIANVAYANATSYADAKAANAYSNAISYANTAAGTAYSNATSYADNKAANAYSNATSYADAAAGTAYSNAVANAAALYQTTAGLAANVATLAANSATYLGNSSGTVANIASWITGNSDTAYTNSTIFASNASNINTGTIAEARLPFRMDQNVATTSTVSFAGLTVSGNLTVNGQYVVVSGNSVVYTDNMLYLNNGVSANITNITSNGTFVVFTANNNYQVGWDVSVTGVNPSSYNGNYLNITAANSTSFTVANTNTDSYVSGGVVRGKTEANPDLGFAAGYNDGTYHHAGFFRDHSSGVWKVFDGYTPEPDASIYIDQTNASFNIAKFQASEIRIGNNSVYGTVNTTNFDGTANNALYLGNSSGTIANIASWVTGNATTAYTNATTYASNASNISAGTLANARLDANVVNTSAAFTITGVHTHNANIVFGSSAAIVANGGFGSNGQVLTSNGTGLYWSSAGFTNGQSISVNNFVITGTLTANSSAGSNGQVLTSNGTGVYWANGGSTGTASVRQTFTANSTVNATFTVANGYVVGFLDVYKNGVKLINGTDVNVNNGSTVVLASPAASGDVIDVVGFYTASIPVVNNAVSVRQTFTANSTVNTTFTVTSGYSAGYIDVYYNGVKLVNGVDVQANNGTTIVLSSPAPSGTTIDVVGLTGGTIINVNASFQYYWTNTHTFASNVSFSSNVDVAANLTIGAAGDIVITNGAGIYANGSFGSAAQVLTSNGTGVYWSTPAGTNTSAQYSWTNTHTFSSNLTVNAASLLVSNATTVSTINTTGIYIGNTTTNVVISNTVSSFSGNVGIGVTPVYPFEVKSATDAILRVTASGATQQSQIQSTNLARSAYAPLTIGGSYTVLETGGSERVRVDASGNVGIGVTPVYKLDVYSASGDSIIASRSAASGAGIFRAVGSNTTFAAYNALISTELNGTQQWYLGGDGVANTIVMKTGTTERMRIDASGNVGIGVTSPSAKLEVDGPVRLRATGGEGGQLELFNPDNNLIGAYLDISSANNTRWFTTVNNSAHQIGQLSGTGGIIALYTEANERMRITASGNVGIGNTAPTHKLRVEGYISDSVGNLRDIPINTQSTTYQIANTDAGETISTTAGVTVNGAILYAGFTVSIYNNSASSITITSGAGVTMYLAGTATTGNRTLAQRGICTVHCVASNTFVISGGGLT